MKIAFVITSVIQVDPSYRLGANKEHPRAVHSTEERLRHTLFTLGTIRASFLDYDIDFYIVEGSNDFEFPLEKVKGWKNLHIYSIKDHNPSLQNIITTHPNKSFCEGLLLLDFFTNSKETLSQYDMVFKVSGRYLPFFVNQMDFDPNKIYFKKPLGFEWNDQWGYDLVDLRQEQQDNLLNQYCSVLFGFGKEHLHKLIDILHILVTMTSKPQYAHYDIETLLYYCTRPFKKHIVETDWKVSGFVGINDNFYWY